MCQNSPPIIIRKIHTKSVSLFLNKENLFDLGQIVNLLKQNLNIFSLLQCFFSPKGIGWDQIDRENQTTVLGLRCTNELVCKIKGTKRPDSSTREMPSFNISSCCSPKQPLSTFFLPDKASQLKLTAPFMLLKYYCTSLYVNKVRKGFVNIIFQLTLIYHEITLAFALSPG